MTEARRFLRYIFPGMLFFVLLFLYLFISSREHLLKKVVLFIRNSGGGGILQAGMFIIFLSGLGYFFATIYHTLVKLVPRWRKPDHSGQVRDAIERGWLNVIRRDSINGDPIADVPINGDPIVEKNKIGPSEAWSITSAYYHARISDEKFKAAHVRIESLNDTLHGLGASSVASIVALFVWFVIHDYLAPPDFGWVSFARSDTGWSSWLISLLLGLLIFFGFHWNYMRTGKEVERMLDGIAFQFMAEESKDGKEPIKLYFPG